MIRMHRGVAVAAVHIAIVASLGAKLMVDRATRPRVWARTAPVDPNAPIRGRYVSLRVEAAIDPQLNLGSSVQDVGLRVEDGRLVAASPAGPQVLSGWAVQRPNGERVAVLAEPVAYFIPEHAPDPSRRPAGEELWVEVTIPRRGTPRPIRLGVKKDGVLTPLDLK